MTDQNSPSEPRDSYHYPGILFYRDGLELLRNSMKFYRDLLQRDIEAIKNDSLLSSLLPDSEDNTDPLVREQFSVDRAIEWLNNELTKLDDRWDSWIPMTHYSVRFFKSTALLYLSAMKMRRNEVLQGSDLSRLALESIDKRITRFDEMLSSGVFARATPTPLLISDLTREAATAMCTGSDLKPLSTNDKSVVSVSDPLPPVLTSIEISDPELRRRCLALVLQFINSLEHDRLDTAVTEATRILEHRLRNAIGADAKDISLDLATKAFGGRQPLLVVGETPAEQEAVHLLFRGVFGYVRNPAHHRLLGQMRPQRALQVVVMVDYLLSILSGAERTTLPSSVPE